MQQEKTLLEQAFDVEAFRKSGYALIDQLADHFMSCANGEGKVLDYHDPEEELAFWTDYQCDSPEQFFKDIQARDISVHHRRYIGHQVSAPAPLSALAGLASEALNDGMGVYEMGAAATAIERVVIKEFCKTIGYDPAIADGVMTSGGTLANLTGLLAARASFQLKHKDPKPFILVSNQAHFCVDRAAMTMGMAIEQVVKIDTLDDYTIDIEQLHAKTQEILTAGGQIMAIVACACSTSTGSYDDLTAIADICEEHNIWMHVDGAHGGAVMWSQKYKGICDGIERADSVIIDAHKMMLTPALATAVLFKKAEDSYRAFAIEAAYLFEKQEDEWFNLAKRTYETTKYMMSIKIFLLLRYYGPKLIDEFVTRQYDLARQFADHVKTLSDFELGHEPMSNIVCFRYTSETNGDLNHINAEIRKALLRLGDFYIVQTTLRGQLFLRITIMSPHTTMLDLKELLDHVRELASSHN